MPKFELKNYTPTPSEKHLGVIEIKVHCDLPFIVRYKLVPKKDGSGMFPTISGYKMPDRSPGEEYDECFMLDSRSDNTALIKFIMHSFHAWEKSNTGPSANSNDFHYPSTFQPQQSQPAPSMTQPDLFSFNGSEKGQGATTNENDSLPF